MKTKINGYNSVTHVDTETGEIICETDGNITIYDSYKTEKELEKEEYEKTHIMNFNEGRSFVKMFTETIYCLAHELTPQEFQIALGLSKFVTYEDCTLMNGVGKHRHYMTLQEIADVMDLEYSRISRIVAGLISKGLWGSLKLVILRLVRLLKYIL